MDKTLPRDHRMDRRFILLTIPRSCSNLLVRMLISGQGTVSHSEYAFNPALFYYGEKLAAASTDQVKTKEIWDSIHTDYDAAAKKLQDSFISPESQNKIPFAKEHVVLTIRPELLYGLEGAPAGSSNSTVLPDNFLLSVTPIFLIRHPALIMASWARTIESTNSSGVTVNGATLNWSRRLFDWYQGSDKQGDGEKRPKPIIVDAADFLTSPALLKRLCVITGFDPDKLVTDWSVAGSEELSKLPPGVEGWIKTLSRSTGVVSEKAGLGISVENEVQKWRAEFPKDVCSGMEAALPREMTDYEYLRGFRLLPDDA